MKIAIISSWFSENMGYAENLLPRSLAKFGNEVHLLTSNAQVYYNSRNYKETYQAFLGPNIVKCGVKKLDGFTLHRLPFYRPVFWNGPGIKGIYSYLQQIKPNIIQTFDIAHAANYPAAVYCKKNGCKLFTESHIHASVFWKNGEITFRKHLGKMVNQINPCLKFINQMTEKCYPISEDASEIAFWYFNVPISKIKIQSLGIDTDLFKPPSESFALVKRKEMRESLGFKDNDIICIYTGRFSKDKNPQCLADAIEHLNKQGEPFKGLFVGNGTSEEISYIKSKQGTTVHKFVQVEKLPFFYWISDIGVWPCQESTSQLDAAACGLPLILSNKIKVMERIDGNGLLYKESNFLDLADKILQLKDIKLRKQMATSGIVKIREQFSWDSIAKQRLADYEASLSVTNH